jgi:chemotaxis protein MotB
MFLLSLFVLAQFFLGREILGKDTVLTRLNAQIAELTDMLQLQKSKSTDLQDTIATLSATLATTKSEKDRLSNQIAGLTSGTGNKDSTIATLTTDLAKQKDLSREASAQVDLLNQQLAALRAQIAALSQALDASETRDTESRTKIADLGRRLNLALAQRVQDLSQYRSDFFGRLRKILADRPDIEIVGDRFVFQSEVLFPAGQADITSTGGQELTKIADAVVQLTKDIPSDISWVLEVDGYTDKRPISTPQFPSNWELSAARAVSVVKYLISQGVPADRLVAAGFGEYHPIDPADTPEAYAKNRRIEFKLTSGEGAAPANG